MTDGLFEELFMKPVISKTFDDGRTADVYRITFGRARLTLNSRESAMTVDDVW